MHHALEVPEILLNIFSNCYTDPSDFVWTCYRGKSRFSHLLALATTCRTFKEPALDVLWKQLPHLSPLARCLPEASSGTVYLGERYWFRRPLTSAEWDVLRSYTFRTRSIHLMNSKAVGLCRGTLLSLSRPPTTKPLFSNVRSVRMEYANNTKSLILLPLPSLISLDIYLRTTRFFENFLRSLAKTSPSLKTLSISLHEYASVDMEDIDPSFICCWQNLQIIDCREISLDVNTLLHLSRMPSLTRLNFTLGDTLPDQFSPSDLPLIFPTLHEFVAASASLGTISRFISQARLPVATSVSVITDFQPFQEDFPIFFSALRTSSSAHNVRKMLLENHCYTSTQTGDKSVLELQNLAPCMVFSHLRLVHFNFMWHVALTDGELFMLASALPQLEELSINEEWGWKTPGGITPDGILQLLQTCPSLSRFALAIDTRGYTAIPSSPESLGLAVRQVSSVDVVDSRIESRSVPAVAAFLSGIVLSAKFSFAAWDGKMGWGLKGVKYLDCWKDVEKQCREMVPRCKASELGQQHSSRCHIV